METFVIQTLEELAVVAGQVLVSMMRADNRSATVLALRGDLGAGKTAFVKLLGQQLGVSEPMVSPTFVVMKSYETTSDHFTTLVHMDAYRIETEADLAPLHFDAVLTAPKTLVCIEWAELISGALPSRYYELSLVDAAGVRTVTFTKHG